MNELSMRFKQAYDYLILQGLILNNKDFAKKIGISTSMVTEIFKGRSNVGAMALQNIVSIFPIDANWLLTGQGEMLVDTNPVVPVHKATDDSLLYNMYKEKEAKIEAQAEQIGELKQTIRQLEEKILGLQQHIRPDTVSGTVKTSVGSTRTRKSGVADSEGARFAEQ